MIKIRLQKKLRGLLVLFCLLATPSYAHRIDYMLDAIPLVLVGIPYIGVGYDVRNPASRDGWSCVPNLIATWGSGRNVEVYGYPGALARWRYTWTPSFYMDIDLGASVVVAISKKGLAADGIMNPISANVGYRFENDMLLGLKLGCHVFYTWNYKVFNPHNLVPCVGLIFSMPIGSGNQPPES